MANYDDITVSGSLPAAGLIRMANSNDSSWTVHQRDIEVGLAAPTDLTYTEYILWGYGSYPDEASVSGSWAPIPASGTVNITLDDEAGLQQVHARFRDASQTESSIITASGVSYSWTEPSKSAGLSWIDMIDEGDQSALLRSAANNTDITFSKEHIENLKFHARDFTGLTVVGDRIAVASGTQIWKLLEYDTDGYASIKKTFSTDATPMITVDIGDGYKTLTTFSGTIKSDVTGDYLDRIANYSFTTSSAAWTAHFDDSDLGPSPAPWPYTTGTWNGSEWVSEEQPDGPPAGTWYVALTPSGTWADGYRPTHIRTTFSGISEMTTYEVYGTNDTQGHPTIVAGWSHVGSQVEIPLDFSAGGDIGQILFNDTDPYSITNIEFLYAEDGKDLNFDVYKFSTYGFATVNSLVFESDSVSAGYINTSINLKVKVYDTNGEGIEGAPVTFSGTGDAIGSFTANPVYTDANGVATATLNLDTLGTATYDATCDGVHTSVDQVTHCYAFTEGVRSLLTQYTQIKESSNFDDAVSNANTSAVAEPTVSGSLDDDMNVLRTMYQQMKGTTDWYGSLGKYFDPTDTDAGDTTNKDLNIGNLAGHTLDSKTVILAVENDNSGAGYDVSTNDTGFVYPTGLAYATPADRRGLPIYASTTNSGSYFDEGGIDDVCVIDLIDTSTGIEFKDSSDNIIYAKFHDGVDAPTGSGVGTDVWIRFYANEAPYTWTASDPSNISIVFPYRKLMSEMEEYNWVRTDFVNGFEGDAVFKEYIDDLWSFTGDSNNVTSPTWTNTSGFYPLTGDPTDLVSAINDINASVGDATYNTTYLTNGEDITASLDKLGLGIDSNDTDIGGINSSLSTINGEISSLQTNVSGNAVNISTNASGIAALEAAIGSSTGTDGLTYSSTNYVTDNTSLLVAIGDLDAAVTGFSGDKYVEELLSDITAGVEHPTPGIYTPVSTAGQEGNNMDIYLDGQLLAASTGAAGVNADRDYSETTTSGVTFTFDIPSGEVLTYIIRD